MRLQLVVAVGALGIGFVAGLLVREMGGGEEQVMPPPPRRGEVREPAAALVEDDGPREWASTARDERPIRTVPFDENRDRRGSSEGPVLRGDVVSFVVECVRDEAGEPVQANIAIRIEQPAGRTKHDRINTDERGRYTFHADAGSTVTIACRRWGYVPVVLPARTLATGVKQVEDIVLSRGLEVSGTLTRRDGGPAGGVRLQGRQIKVAGGEGPDLWSESGSFTTIGRSAEDGSYRLQGWLPGRIVRRDKPAWSR